MQKVQLLQPREAADLINDDDVITVSSSSALGCPDAVLSGIGQRFDETGERGILQKRDRSTLGAGIGHVVGARGARRFDARFQLSVWILRHVQGNDQPR